MATLDTMSTMKSALLLYALLPLHMAAISTASGVGLLEQHDSVYVSSIRKKNTDNKFEQVIYGIVQEACIQVKYDKTTPGASAPVINPCQSYSVDETCSSLGFEYRVPRSKMKSTLPINGKVQFEVYAKSKATAAQAKAVADPPPDDTAGSKKGKKKKRGNNLPRKKKSSALLNASSHDYNATHVASEDGWLESPWRKAAIDMGKDVGERFARMAFGRSAKECAEVKAREHGYAPEKEDYESMESHQAKHKQSHLLLPMRREFSFGPESASPILSPVICCKASDDASSSPTPAPIRACPRQYTPPTCASQGFSNVLPHRAINTRLPVVGNVQFQWYTKTDPKDAA